MKKSIVVIAIVALMSSCSKNQTCTCDVISDAPNTPPKKEIINTSKQTKRQARKGLCSTYQEKVDGVTILHNCKLD